MHTSGTAALTAGTALMLCINASPVGPGGTYRQTYNMQWFTPALLGMVLAAPWRS